jgi:hypothetical protein
LGGSTGTPHAEKGERDEMGGVVVVIEQVTLEEGASVVS